MDFMWKVKEKGKLRVLQFFGFNKLVNGGIIK